MLDLFFFAEDDAPEDSSEFEEDDDGSPVSFINQARARVAQRRPSTP